jgi:hypothetical protein
VNSDFDLDFAYGYEGETLVEELLTNGKTVEVKRDRRWKDTNNLFIEVQCWYNKTQSWELSGLSVTKADYWAFVLESGVLIVATNDVDFAINTAGRPITCDIEPNKSRGYLVTVNDLLNAMKLIK